MGRHDIIHLVMSDRGGHNCFRGDVVHLGRNDIIHLGIDAGEGNLKRQQGLTIQNREHLRNSILHLKLRRKLNGQLLELIIQNSILHRGKLNRHWSDDILHLKLRKRDKLNIVILYLEGSKLKRNLRLIINMKYLIRVHSLVLKSKSID